MDTSLNEVRHHENLNTMDCSSAAIRLYCEMADTRGFKFPVSCGKYYGDANGVIAHLKRGKRAGSTRH